jgi:signal transduction histidine kinase
MLLTVQLMDEYHASVPSEKFREWTESITRGAEYMLNIISNLLDVNKIEAGKMEMNIEPVNASIIELITDAYTFRASEKGIHLHFTPLKSKIHFLADRNSIQQIMENLISNAIKFSEKETTVVVRTVQHNTTVQIEVQDAGPGLSPDDKAKLFGKFARLSARPTGGEHSTGLGLSIVKKMVEAMNGKVWCESELGKGATFIVELPKA